MLFRLAAIIFSCTIILSFIPGGELVRHISVNNDTELQQYLCYNGSAGGQQPLKDEGTVLVLKRKEFHLNSSSEFCIVRDFSNLTVKSDFDSSTIKCSRPTAGFTIVNGCGLAFMNGVGLNLDGIQFNLFGSAMDRSVIQDHNSTVLPGYFGTNQTASIIFSNVTSLKISRLNISYYYGFGIVFVNCFGNTSLTDITVSSSLSQTACDPAVIHSLTHNNYTCFGSGLLVYYHDIVNDNSYSNEVIETLFTLINSSFENNTYEDTHSICITNLFQFQKDRIPVVAVGAGVTVYTTQSQYRVSIDFNGLKVVGNDGALSGGIATIFINTPFQSNLTIRNSQIKNSNNSWFSCFGQSLLMYVYFTDDFLEHAKAKSIAIEHFSDIWTPLSVIDTDITDNVGANRSSSVYLAIRSQCLYEVQSLFTGVLFANNQAFFTGICMYAETVYEPMIKTPKLLRLHLKNINSTSNSQVHVEGSAVVLSNSSQFVFHRVGRALVEGEHPYSSSFVNNLGSVLDAFNSEIYLKGSVEFINNSAAMGAAILLRSGSFLVIGENSSITFHGNNAYQHGGAIYSSEKGTENYYCILQIDAKGRNLSESNIHIDIQNNNARGSGNFAYLSPLFHCFQTRFHVYPRALSSFYSTLFDFTEDELYNEVGTDPGRIHVCCYSPSNDLYRPECNDSRILYEVFPGDDIVVHLVAYDDINNMVTSQVNASMSIVGESSYAIPHDYVYIEPSQAIKFIVTKNCTPVRYTIYSGNISKELGQLNFAVPDRQPLSSVEIKIKPCPPGFQLNSYEGVCECMDFFDSLVDVSCNVSTKTVQRNSFYNWIGVVDDRTEKKLIGYAEYCPVGFCNTSVQLVDMSKSTNANTCINNRKGTICGNCIDGYSIAHGNDGGECMPCTNRGLWWLVGYFSSGIIMVLVLFVFKLTIDHGTIAGIIFYANIFRIVKVTLNLSKPYFLPFLQLIELLNLHQAFGSCFVEGMEYAYTYVIEYCYSFYLWSIVIVIIVIARCSTRLTQLIMGSSVQVLITVVHLSFIKVLISVIDTFTYAKVWFSDNSTYNVWLYNGTIHYGQGKHLPLLLTACVFSVFFIVPFLLIGIFGSLCLRFNIINKIRPAIDTVHSPYKDRFRYWYGVRLLLLVFVAIINPLLLGVRNPFITLLIQLFLVTLFTLFQVNIKPFTKGWINILDLWCMLNVIYLLLVNLYGLQDGGKSSGYFLLLNIVLVSLTILIVFTYHAVMLVRRCLVAIPCTRRCIESPCFNISINHSNLYQWLRNKVHYDYADIDEITVTPLPTYTPTRTSVQQSTTSDDVQKLTGDGTKASDTEHELSTCKDYCNLREPLLELLSSADS